MNVLIAHNRYQQRGGEDEVFAHETALLRSRGHKVVLYEATNDDLASKSKLVMLSDTIWNQKTYRTTRDLLRQERIEVVHVHNTFPILSPSIYHAAQAEGVPVVQTLHNYRLLCPGATMFRNGRVCEDCVPKVSPWPAVQHACYRQSRVTTAATAAMLTVHRAMGTWSRTVSRYIALSEFCRMKFVEGGLPAQKISVKPNFVDPDPGMGVGDGGYALFIGRLSPEKGLATMLEAWKQVGHRMPLKIIGDGPLAPEVRAACEQTPGVEMLGWMSRDQVVRHMNEASVLIVPSTWYEVFGMILIEAFAAGLPVIASEIGSIPHIVRDRQNGLLFRAGDAQDLAAKVAYVESHPEEWARMRLQARRDYEQKYTGEQNYLQLMHIYSTVLAGAKAEPRVAAKGLSVATN